MVRKLFIALLTLTCAGAHAQTVNAYVLKDDPVNVNCFRILWDPFYFNTWKPNPTGGMGLGCLFNAGRVFNGELNFRFAYKDKYHVKGDNTIPKFSQMDMLFYFYLGKQTQLHPYKIKISNTANGYTYINQQLKRRVAFGFRTGISILSTGMNYESVHAYYIKKSDTVYFSGTGKYSELLAIAGWSVKFVHCALVSLDGYRSAEGGCAEVYMDVLPLLSMTTGYVVPAYDTSAYDVHIPVLQKMGVRFGWRYYDPARSNFSFGLELGTYAGPHYEKNYTYFLFRLGFAFGDKVKE